MVSYAALNLIVNIVVDIALHPLFVVVVQKFLVLVDPVHSVFGPVLLFIHVAWLQVVSTWGIITCTTRLFAFIVEWKPLQQSSLLLFELFSSHVFHQVFELLLSVISVAEALGQSFEHRVEYCRSVSICPFFVDNLFERMVDACRKFLFSFEYIRKFLVLVFCDQEKQVFIQVKVLQALQNVFNHYVFLVVLVTHVVGHVWQQVDEHVGNVADQVNRFFLNSHFRRESVFDD